MTARALGPSANPVVLVVDDVQANRELLEGHLDQLGYDVRQARDGVEALDAVAADEPDLILLDIDMPRMDGITLCRRLKADPVRRLVPVVLVTAHQDRATRLRGLEAGADDFLTKPFDSAELLVRTKSLLRDRELNKQLDAAEGVIMALARVIEARDRYTIHHAERVGLYSREIGLALGLAEPDLDVLYKGGVMHDLGKVVIPAEILLKSGPLNSTEREIMETHAPEGSRIAEPLRSAAKLIPVIRHHHERVDGRGYPDHLAGDEIPLAARIAAIGTQWDAELTGIFIELIDADVVECVAREQYRIGGRSRDDGRRSGDGARCRRDIALTPPSRVRGARYDAPAACTPKEVSRPQCRSASPSTPDRSTRPRTATSTSSSGRRRCSTAWSSAWG